MKSNTFARRSFLKVAGVVGAGAASAFHTCAAWAKSGAAKAAAGARPAELADFKGSIITRADPSYLGWLWAMTWYRIKPRDQFPIMFARPTSQEDLSLLMEYANKKDIQMVARSSGHNICNTPLAQDAITVDMSLWDEIGEIDTENRTVWAGPRVLSQPLNQKLFEKGLAFPSAHTGFVTIGGYLLGGGMGWNMPAWGMGCASVLAAEVMLADGRVVIASADENTDLYWAIRGVGPGFFGIILRYKLQLHPAPKIIKNTYFYTLDNLEEAVARYKKLLPESNNRSEILGALGRFNPPGTPPEEETWHWAVNVFSYGDTEEAALEAAKVITESDVGEIAVSNPVVDEPVGYMDLYNQLMTDFYAQFRTTEIAIFTDDPAPVLKYLGETLSAKAIDPRSFGFSVLGSNPTVPEPACYTYKAPHYISCYLMGDTNEDVQHSYALMAEMYEAIKPYIKGYYINEIDLTQFPHMAKDCFSEEKWNKLLAVRDQFDPNKRFVSYLDDWGQNAATQKESA